jgi:DnaJ-class molecular chaperone
MTNGVKEQEQTCDVCQGAGLLNDNGSKHTFSVRVCTNCNGHGVVLMGITENKRGDKFTRIHRYTMTEGIPCE